jgi:hypothetical protein
VGGDDRLGAVGLFQLQQDVLGMSAHGFLADKELLSYLPE